LQAKASSASIITVHLEGGLGNQLFQMAAAICHAKQFGARLVMDYGARHTAGQGAHPLSYWPLLFPALSSPQEAARCSDYFYEQSFAFAPIPFRPYQHLVGYFQSYRYSGASPAFITTLFRSRLASVWCNEWNETTSFLESLRMRGKRSVVVAHVRRGDYLLHSTYHAPLSPDYYQEGVRKISALTPRPIVCVIVSDDPQYCSKRFPSSWIVSPFSSELSDLMLLMHSDHVIIANSSFSWWGAYLNPNEGKTIIAPSRWFGPLGPTDTEDLIPPAWIRF
jgi:hypothetical protein